tara:strand:- start:1836 stop:2117 length:282 start_codon:yes stop_codon:yes gene_type:complete
MSYTREYIEKTLRQLTGIFYKHLQMVDLHTYNTEAKMMKMLREESGEDWETDYILDLSKNNKIEWVRGIDDPRPSDIYQKAMNARLTEVLCTK